MGDQQKRPAGNNPLDNIIHYVGNAFSVANATLSAATATVLGNLSGGRLDKAEVASEMQNAGDTVRTGLTEAMKNAELAFQPRPPLEQDLRPVDGETEALFQQSFTHHWADRQFDRDMLQAIQQSMETAQQHQKPVKNSRPASRQDPFMAGPGHVSTINPRKAHQIRQERAESMLVSSDGMVYFDQPAVQLLLPSFERYPSWIRNVVLSNLVAGTVQSYAEQKGMINSSLYCNRQYVLNTMGDGNCLSHACSLGVWGVHDRDKRLRHAIQGTMGNAGAGDEVQRRFYASLERQGLPREEWQVEWNLELEAVKNESRYLVDVHCFVLANVLRRPIIIYGDTTTLLGGLAGIYLPLLWDPTECSSVPVCVLYNQSHFSLLCVIEGESPSGEDPLIQLSTASNNPLSVRFTLPNEMEDDLVMRYMAVIDLPDGARAAIFRGKAMDNILVNLMTAILQSQM